VVDTGHELMSASTTGQDVTHYSTAVKESKKTASIVILTLMAFASHQCDQILIK